MNESTRKNKSKDNKFYRNKKADMITILLQLCRSSSILTTHLKNV